MRRRDEQGAVVPLVAVMLTVIITVAALTVDIGRQRVARTDMQSVADVVALDLARELDGRSASAISSTLQAAADRSLARNASASGDGIAVVPELGTLSPAGVFSAVSGSTKPDAVRVTATTTVDFAFRPGTGGASRTAIATSHPQACYKLGSWGARLSTSTDANLLYQVLAAHGVGASVGAVTYQSLAGAHVDLKSLAAALGLASPEALATTSVSLATLLNAVAQVVGTNGSSSAQVAALDMFRASLGSLAAKPVAIGNLVSIATGAGSGLSGAVNLADLVVGAVLVADGNSAATVDLAGTVTGLGNLKLSVTLVQGARAACGFAGSTPSQSNQVTVTTSTAPTLTTTSVATGITGIGLVDVSLAGPVVLTATTAYATGSLTDVVCNRTTRSASVATSGGLLNATFQIPLNIKVLGLITISTTFTATLTSTGSATTVTITVPPQAYDTPYSNGGAQPQLPSATYSAPTAGIGALSLGQVTSILAAVQTSLVAPMVSSLNTNVIGPLSDLAGLRTAGADVLLLDHPSCSTPALRG